MVERVAGRLSPVNDGDQAALARLSQAQSQPSLSHIVSMQQPHCGAVPKWANTSSWVRAPWASASLRSLSVIELQMQIYDMYVLPKVPLQRLPTLAKCAIANQSQNDRLNRNAATRRVRA